MSRSRRRARREARKAAQLSVANNTLGGLTVKQAGQSTKPKGGYFGLPLSRNYK